MWGHCEGGGKWTWDEYHTTLNHIMAMIRSVSHRVDLINVEHPGSSMPPGSPQPHFQRAAKLFPPNMGFNIVVTNSLLGKAIGALMTRLPGNLMGKVKMVGSLDEAYALIQRESAKSDSRR